MAKPSILTDLALAIQGLERVRPYSTSVDARVWRAALTNLKGVEAVLLTVDAFKPGVFRALVAAAIEELQVEHDDPIPEITDLVGRYCKKREPLR